MIRSAAKNFQDVAIVTSPADYDAIAERTRAIGRRALAAKPNGVSHRKLSPPPRPMIRPSPPRSNASAQTVASSLSRRSQLSHPTLRLSFNKTLDLRYGENPHQKAAMYSDGSGAGVANARQLQGKELSYNNIVDLQAAWDLAQEFDAIRSPVCAIIKHTNPCGAATGKTLAEAYKRALECDPVSAFGGVIGVNRPIDAEAAEEMAQTFPRSHRRARLRRSRQGKIRHEEKSAPGGS